MDNGAAFKGEVESEDERATRVALAAAIRQEGIQNVAKDLGVGRETILAFAGDFPTKQATRLLIKTRWAERRAGARTAA